MSHPNTERDERVRQISDELLGKIEAATVDGFSVAPGTGLALCHTVRFLRQQNRELKAIVDIGTSDDPGTALAKVHKIQDDAATRIRDRCVVHLQATADALDVRQETECPSGTAFNSEAILRRRIAIELQSLTLEVEEKQ